MNLSTAFIHSTYRLCATFVDTKCNVITRPLSAIMATRTTDYSAVYDPSRWGGNIYHTTLQAKAARACRVVTSLKNRLLMHIMLIVALFERISTEQYTSVHYIVMRCKDSRKNNWFLIVYHLLSYQNAVGRLIEMENANHGIPLEIYKQDV